MSVQQHYRGVVGGRRREGNRGNRHGVSFIYLDTRTKQTKRQDSEPLTAGAQTAVHCFCLARREQSPGNQGSG